MSDDIYINIDDEQPKPVDVVQVEFDKQDVYIDVQQDYAPVLAVNGKVGYVTITAEDIGFSGNANLTNIVYTTGNQTISGIKVFTSRPTVNNSGVLLNGEAYPSNNPSGFITSVQGIPSGGLGGQVLIKENQYQDYLTNWRYLNAQDVNAAERLNSVDIFIPSGADNTPVIAGGLNTGISSTNNIFITGANQYYSIVKRSFKDLTINLPTFANFGDRIAIRRGEPVQDNNKGAFIINRLGGNPYSQTISVLPRNGNIFYCIWIGLWVPDFVPPAGFEGAPLSSTSFGVPGQMAYEEPYLYICVSNNQWRRIAISDWS